MKRSFRSLVIFAATLVATILAVSVVVSQPSSSQPQRGGFKARPTDPMPRFFEILESPKFQAEMKKILDDPKALEAYLDNPDSTEAKLGLPALPGYQSQTKIGYSDDSMNEGSSLYASLRAIPIQFLCVTRCKTKPDGSTVCWKVCLVDTGGGAGGAEMANLASRAFSTKFRDAIRGQLGSLEQALDITRNPREAAKRAGIQVSEDIEVSASVISMNDVGRSWGAGMVASNGSSARRYCVRYCFGKKWWRICVTICVDRGEVIAHDTPTTSTSCCTVE